MNQLLWHLRTSSAFECLSALAVPFAIFFVQYEVDYVFLLVRHFVLIALHGFSPPPVAPGERPAALLVIPTMVRSDAELAGLQAAIASAATNDYRGPFYIVVAIDDGASHRDMYVALETWIASYAPPEGVHIFATCLPERRGKACAIDTAVQLMLRKVETGELAELPPVFFNMDADSELGPKALIRMADRLVTPSPFTGVRPRLITSNVSIAREHYWFGWRGLFTVRGQIALQVAREYLTAISIGKFNTKLVPILWASGALYCTWTQLHIVSPRWGAFMQTLRLRDWMKWWVGFAPPSFADSDVEDLPEAQTGPGDDTWMTWLACCSRWGGSRGDELVVELPRTPVHAACYAVYDYLVRPVRHEPEARIMTRTPTTIKALFKQRIRWNTSRIQDVQRWQPALMYHWTVGIPALVSTTQLVVVNLAVAVSLLVWPFVPDGGGSIAFVAALGLNLFMRTVATLLGLVIDGRGNAPKLLALPLSIPYHMVFNVLPTIVGAVQDIFLFGVNTKFSPERTHIRSGTVRIAMAFRVRRALALAVRSILVNDVPLGLFWFGWRETPWTPSGFEGWTSGKKPRAILPPLLQRKAQPEAASSGAAAAEPVNAVAAAASVVAEAAPASRRPSLVQGLGARGRSQVVSLVPPPQEQEQQHEQDSSEVARRDAA